MTTRTPGTHAERACAARAPLRVRAVTCLGETMLAGDLDGDGATVVAARRGSGFTVDLERDDRADLTVARGRSDADLLDPR